MQSPTLTLQKLTLSLTQRTEVIVIFVVIGIVFMMILPLPTALVDVLIALNISVSILLVVLAMYMSGPLAFSTFPALLLITTLFRLALSITTTRLILMQGDAGTIVEVFGNFVVGGNLVVGLVIFLILTLVNFIVITKGSERVAEVAARFTLDAMPGKQMSIDSDLRAGLIDAPTAQQKRANIGRESQLFGAMDGAMKFVKGDAIAGIIIVLINILGGFSIGVLQLGLPAGEAIKMYSILTIGDGLIAQIPALLISLTAGLIITRVTDESAGQRNVGQEMSLELFREPKAWVIAALVMLFFALIPGMPFLAFMTLALIFGGAGGYKIWAKNKQDMHDVQQRIQSQHADKDDQLQAEVEDGTKDIRTFLPYDRLSFMAHRNVERNPGFQEVIKIIRRMRNRIVTEKGYTLPPLGIAKSKGDEIDMDEFRISIHGVPRFFSSLSIEKIVIKKEDMKESLLNSLGKKCHQGKASRNEDMVYWIDPSCESKIKKEKVPYMRGEDFISNRTIDFLKKESYQFIGVEEVGKLISWLEKQLPKLAEELQKVLPAPKFGEILRNLAQENISIRSVKTIVETLVDKAAIERDIPVLTDHVRIALRDQICHELTINNQLNVCLLEPELEDILRNSIRQTANGPFLALNEEDRQHLINEIQEQEQGNTEGAFTMVVAQDLRSSLRELIKNDLFHIPVLTYSEITPSVSVVPVARISI